MTEQKHPKITVSVPTFHEIAQQLEKLGIKISEAKTILLEKGSDLVPPIDWRLVTVRKDAVEVAAKLIEFCPDATDPIDFADKIYNYIVYNRKNDEDKISSIETTKEWK